jgi:hypothetical protein
MVRYLIVAVVVIASFGLAQRYALRQGTTATLTTQQLGADSQLTLMTDPAITQQSEMTFFIYNRDTGRPGGTIRRTIPPSQPGQYVLTLPLQDGRWGISFRYGVGLDIYYAYSDHFVSQGNPREVTHHLVFRGALRQDTPRHIQTLGFGILAVVLMVALSLVTTLLKHLKQQTYTL